MVWVMRVMWVMWVMWVMRVICWLWGDVSQERLTSGIPMRRSLGYVSWMGRYRYNIGDEDKG